MRRKERMTVRLPLSLKKAAEDFAERDGVSVNQYIARALAEKISAQGAAEFLAERRKNGDQARALAFLEGRPD